MKLIVGNKYNLKYTRQFCHIMNKEGILDEMTHITDAVFIGTVSLSAGERNIFLKISGAYTSYIMFSTKNLDYIEENSTSLIQQELDKLKHKILELEELIKH